MKVALFSNTDWYLYNFREKLISGLIKEGYEPVLVSPPGPWVEKLVALGVRWRPVPMSRRGFNPLREIRAIIHLWRILREEDVVLVHNFTVKCAVYGSLVAMALGIKRINALAGLGFAYSSGTALARSLRVALSWVFRMVFAGEHCRLVFQNPEDLAVVARLGIRNGGSFLIPSSGVDTGRFTPSDKRSDVFRVVLAARLLRDKGVIEFLKAADLLFRKGLRIDFLLAGEPDPGNPDSLSLSDLDDWLKASPVRWLGHVSATAELFRSCDVMVLPSYYGEGVPRSLVEGAACGLGLVTTDMPGCRLVVLDGETGILVPPRDVEALANALERLYLNPALTHKLGSRARERAVACFDAMSVNQRTIALYGEMLS